MSTAGIELRSQTMDLSRMVMFDTWHAGGRYERFQRLAVLQGATATIKFHGENLAVGGLSRAFEAAQYHLLMDSESQPRATATITSGSSYGEFTLDLSGISQGWHSFEISGGTTETCPRWFMYVDKGQPRNDPFVPVASGSYDVAHRGTQHFTAMIPRGLTPAPVPFTPRECPPFSEPLTLDKLVRENIVPAREGNINRTNVSTDGVYSTFNQQAYFWSDLILKKPPLPLHDGPRNVGTLMMPTAVLVTRQGGAYFADPWRVGRVAPDGTVTTRAGYRHRNPASYYRGEQDLELVGDWSAIPVERRGFHEIWGIVWDGNSLVTDPNAAPIDGEQPHVTGPRLFVADSQNNRVVLLSFNHNNHDAPVVTEFLTGLQDPWDVAWADNVLYVSERKAHRIAAYDARTGAFLRTVVSGQALATIDVHREVYRAATLDAIRAQPCVAPEGLFYQDGWLHFGSKANGQVRKVNLSTGELKVICDVDINGNSKFLKISLSDGTFGPRGTVFTWTWSNRNYGMPDVFLPDGTYWYFNNYAPVSRGRGRYTAIGYGSAGGVGMGRLFCGSSEEGLIQISKALPSDSLPDARAYGAGLARFQEKGYNLLHGHDGYGYHGFALPWGESADLDYFLTWNGHKRPTTT